MSPASPAMPTEPAMPDGAPDPARRPTADPLVVAMVGAAVDQVWPVPMIGPEPAAGRPSKLPAWRFSGRWWSRPATTRRDRPSTGG